MGVATLKLAMPMRLIWSASQASVEIRRPTSDDPIHGAQKPRTTTTTWMKKRSQMLRHMDAAYEIAGNKKVLGMMIIEGPGGADAVTPSVYWQKEAEAQVAPQMLKASLPHRTPSQRSKIAEGFLGVTTWQRVCSELNLPWPPVQGQA